MCVLMNEIYFFLFLFPIKEILNLSAIFKPYYTRYGSFSEYLLTDGDFGIWCSRTMPEKESAEFGKSAVLVRKRRHRIDQKITKVNKIKH